MLQYNSNLARTQTFEIISDEISVEYRSAFKRSNLA